MLTRREFLAFAASITSPTLVSAVHAADRAATSPLIDTHTHFYDPTRPQGLPWPSANNKLLYKKTLPADFRDVAAPHGVTGTVIVEASPWLEDNQWILDLAEDDPTIVGFVGNLPAGTPEFKQHVERFAKHAKYRGIRIRGAELADLKNNAPYLSDMRRLADADLSVDLLGNAAMLPHALVLADLVPQLRIVIDHLPFEFVSAQPAYHTYDKHLQELSQRKNVYLKVSHVLRLRDGQPILDLAHYRPSLDRLWELFGPDRVIYGSNWPVSNHLAPYENVIGIMKEYLADKSAEVQAAYFWRNAKAAYKWVS